MSADETPEVVQIPVKRYDVNLTFDDILNPLIQHSTTNLTQASPSTAQAGVEQPADPQVAQHLQTISDLASRLQDEVNKLNQIDPTILNPQATSQPSPTQAEGQSPA